MLKKLQATIDSLASHATIWPWLAGSGIMSAVAGWATYATALFRPYAPFSWVAAVFLGALIFSCVYALAAQAKSLNIDSSIKSEFYKSSDRVNPLDITFRERRINISDLVSPIEPYVRGKTFIDCELIRPANIALSATAPGKGAMNGVAFFGCNACRVKNDAVITNGIMFEDCTFLRGKMFKITLFIPDSGYEQIKRSMPGLPWISLD